ncbi:MAG TPA: DEAD/DEAH box helicase family protein [Erysipelotrichaceae bacterium]|nr:DEAD/DEAH box helicase family protein [Erysipelotrichaceae bacterium]
MTITNDYICPICGNADTKYIGFKNGKPYCRKCIMFRGQEVSGEYIISNSAEYQISYELSDDQKRLSSQLVQNFMKGVDTLVHAVCGSGKTEICLEIITYCINNKLRVGFSVPRKDVVIELTNRFKEIFKNNNVISIYGGHNNILEGDLVVLTAHQLYRFNKYFDLLIMDEIDAFPYKDNEVLEAFFYRSIKKNYILMTATPTPDLIKLFKKPQRDIVELYSRFHRHPLPVPKIIKGNWLYLNYKLIKEVDRLLKSFKQIFVFVPTIDLSIKIYKFLSLFFKNGNFINSQCEDREKIIKRFHTKKYRYLVTTAVLERGVTVKDLQVIVYRSDHVIYDSYSLIQIAGRVGRKKEAPEGEVIFLARRKNQEMQRAIDEINAANKKLQNLF